MANQRKINKSDDTQAKSQLLADGGDEGEETKDRSHSFMFPGYLTILRQM
jgi:hypothetical protein